MSIHSHFWMLKVHGIEIHFSQIKREQRVFQIAIKNRKTAYTREKSGDWGWSKGETHGEQSDKFKIQYNLWWMYIGILYYVQHYLWISRARERQTERAVSEGDEVHGGTSERKREREREFKIAIGMCVKMKPPLAAYRTTIQFTYANTRTHTHTHSCLHIEFART